MNIDVLTAFNSLQQKQKREANRIINDYIKNLPEEDYQQIIECDFRNVISDDIFYDIQNKAKTMNVRHSTAQEIEKEPQLFQDAVKLMREIENNSK
jgi:hypothetical protein